MKKSWMGIGAIAVLALAAASALALADFGGNGGAQDLEIQGPPPDGSCLCPANWDPVVCRAADGSRHAYSNACVAGCAGYTDCSRIVASPQ